MYTDQTNTMDSLIRSLQIVSDANRARPQNHNYYILFFLYIERNVF